MKHLYFIGVIFFLTVCSPVKKYAADSQKWETDMQRFDSLNQVTKYPKNAILFAGSSSIRLWDSIAYDMAPYPVIKRGYGGASYADLAYYIERIVYPHDFKAVVLFAGNDIWGNETDRTPKEISQLLNYSVKKITHKYKDTPIFVIEITHVPAREHLIKEIDDANQALKSVCHNYSQVHWIGTKQLFLTADNKVDRQWFRDDNVHQNRKGYNRWTKTIKTAIKKVMKE